MLGAANLLFLAADASMELPHRAEALAARTVLSVALLGSAWLLGRPLSPTARSRYLRVLGAVLALSFGALVWSSGGYHGVYGGFFALLPLIFAIVVPDDPIAVLACGLCVIVTGAPMTDWGGGKYGVAFWLLGSGAIATYATLGSWFQREQSRRESAALLQAAQAKRRLEELERSRDLDGRLALLGTLVAGVAHELRNPLSVVTANLSMMKEDNAVAPQADPMLHDVELGVKRIAHLVEDLRAFARNEPEAAQEHEVSALVDGALRLASMRLKGVASLQRDLPATLPRVLVPRPRVEQVLVNLLVNAADALESRGPLAKQGVVKISASQMDGCVALVVEDSGPGFSPDILPRLFEPFATTKGKDGTGLGLALSRQYIEDLGGRIEAGTSTLGGARFTIHLPVAVAPSRSEKA
ncbi:MAG: ATP-binding protein [Myxococcales bacterium]